MSGKDGDVVISNIVTGDVKKIEAWLPADVAVVGAVVGDLAEKGTGMALAAMLSPSNGMETYVLAATPASKSEKVQLFSMAGHPCPFEVTDSDDIYAVGAQLQLTEVEVHAQTTRDICQWSVTGTSEPDIRQVAAPSVMGNSGSAIRLVSGEKNTPDNILASAVSRAGMADDTAVFKRLLSQVEASAGRGGTMRIAAHFWPRAPISYEAIEPFRTFAFPVTLAFAVGPKQAVDTNDYNCTLRDEVHKAFDLPPVPLFRISQRLRVAGGPSCPPQEAPLLKKTSKAGPRLQNVHAGLLSLQKTATLRVEVVAGVYDYYHYRCDGFDDDGWGCAYRSMQTLLSWYLRNHYAVIEVPRIRDIQEMLLEIDTSKKDAKFVGSREWIGSTEIWLALERLCGVSCTVQRLDRGDLLDSDAGLHHTLLHHFKHNKTPIMIGGSKYAHTILGIAFDESTHAVRLLILDPHYSAATSDLSVIQSNGWCQWKQPSKLFKSDSWYNLCMPRRPRTS
eukprot:gene16126-24701_t